MVLNLFLFLALNVSVVGLERALAAYVGNASETPFDMKTVPISTAPIHEQKPSKKGMNKCFYETFQTPRVSE